MSCFIGLILNSTWRQVTAYNNIYLDVHICLALAVVIATVYAVVGYYAVADCYDVTGPTPT